MKKKVGFGTRPSEIKQRRREIEIGEAGGGDQDDRARSAGRPQKKKPSFSPGRLLALLLIGAVLIGAGAGLGYLISRSDGLTPRATAVSIVIGQEKRLVDMGGSITLSYDEGLIIDRVVFSGLHRLFPPDDVSITVPGVDSAVRRDMDIIPLIAPEEKTAYDIVVSRGGTGLGKISFTVMMDADAWIQRASVVKDRAVRTLCYEKAIDENPDSVSAHIALGRLYEQQDKPEKAAGEYESVLALESTNKTALQALIPLYKKTGQTTKLVYTYERIAGLDTPRADEYYCEAGRLEEKLGDTKKAMYFYRKALAENRANLDARRLLIKIYERNGQWNRVAGNTRVLLEYEPGNANLYLYASDAYAKMESIRAAINYAKKAEKLTSGGNADIYQHLALLYSRAGEYEEAAEYYRKAVRSGRKSATMYNNLGVVLEKQNKLEEATRYYKKAVESDPGNTGYLANLADAYEKQKDWKQAAAAYEKLTKRDSTNKKAFEAMAVMYYKAGNKWKALEAYQALSRLEPKQIAWHQKMAALYEQLNRLDKARQQYKQILALDPDNSEAKQKYLDLGVLQYK